MYLKELTIQGFKSFAKKSDLLFQTSVTGIVGPNGSGKSNVSEAFRFVLGEQSPARMRSKKGEDLIFNGSQKAARQNRASVRVVFDNTARAFPVDFDEVIVERVVHRDGTNEYSIGGARVRLKDVQELFAAAHIGSTGHHIISQGEADRILSASPKFRREMIEDALGLKLYQIKKTESERKLEKTRENIERVESLRRETKPHLQFLERQVKKYERANTLRESIAAQYAEYLAREKAYITYTDGKLSQALDIHKKRRDELSKELSILEKALTQNNSNEESPELVTKERELKDILAEYNNTLREHGSVDGQLGFIERRIVYMRDEYAKKIAKGNKVDAPIPYNDFAEVHTSLTTIIKHALTVHDVTVLHRALRDVVVILDKLVRNRATDIQAPALDLTREERERDELIEKKRTVDEKLRVLSERKQVVEHSISLIRKSILDEREKKTDAMLRVDRVRSHIQEEERAIQGVHDKRLVLQGDTEEFEREVREAVALVRSRALQYLKHPIIEGDRTLSEEEVATEDRSLQRQRRRSLEREKIRFEEIGGINDAVVKEYETAKARDDFLAGELSDLAASEEKLRAIITELTAELHTRFIDGIEKISTEFNQFFTAMFRGGSAKLVRIQQKSQSKNVDTSQGEDVLPVSVESEFEEESTDMVGVDIDVALPNKRLRGLEMLSGGERALTSIALIFAMSQINPPPFIILDETDAALDEANSRRYGDMLEILAKKSQLILITHNRETMSRAGLLYGVTMGQDGVSRLLSIQLEDALVNAK